MFKWLKDRGRINEISGAGGDSASEERQLQAIQEMAAFLPRDGAFEYLERRARDAKRPHVRAKALVVLLTSRTPRGVLAVLRRLCDDKDSRPAWHHWKGSGVSAPLSLIGATAMQLLESYGEFMLKQYDAKDLPALIEDAASFREILAPLDQSMRWADRRFQGKYILTRMGFEGYAAHAKEADALRDEWKQIGGPAALKEELHFMSSVSWHKKQPPRPAPPVSSPVPAAVSVPPQAGWEILYGRRTIERLGQAPRTADDLPAFPAPDVASLSALPESVGKCVFKCCHTIPGHPRPEAGVAEAWGDALGSSLQKALAGAPSRLLLSPIQETGEVVLYIFWDGLVSRAQVERAAAEMQSFLGKPEALVPQDSPPVPAAPPPKEPAAPHPPSLLPEAAAFLWFNSRVISDAGNSLYGQEAYRRVLPLLAPIFQKDPRASFALFDGDCMTSAASQKSFFRPQDGELLNEVQSVGESLCYVIAALGQSAQDWEQIHRAVKQSGGVGYLGMTLQREFDREQFLKCQRSMALVPAIRIVGATFHRIDFAFVGDAELRLLGFNS